MTISKIFILIIFAFSAIWGQNMTAIEIMERNDAQTDSRDSMGEFTMKLINKKGKVRSRTVIQYSQTDDNGLEKSIIKFTAPANVRGVGLLTVEEMDQDNQWLYLPATKRVRRISSNQKSDNFMGSDFTYEDIERNDLDDYTYNLFGEQIINSIDCYIIESRATSEKILNETEYGFTKMWISKDHFLQIQVNFYNKKNELIKVMRNSEISKLANTDKWRAHHIIMENIKSGHQTELIFKEMQINQGVEESYFTQRYLEKG
ncbi:MAG: outer membrane lipoprotein-sorting protein [Candidatus Marinimicrobia bacterium]|jgi:outer membrane lipoprotein-sorting protein|nr:outer membrane lipoprotein-sorting protein [Candidatus Neomarinimicrobiota bacterium]MBT3634802.1 outer membrane lipoprotein-sorting protein [Candidatus Neomarinimicrobiota bacterium]MBT3683584.1 outer membrane lipoprotein-sorting protein [Candidatus Neomarinimicrobiota bacterium]MBT3760455.1 outer membrane lipoprotein-sorting protein [Candidatus Neomarinimicrobiota bacterium]MBT3896601.1 outer membrane lipoprotein-sorting protein [Candidatus Neomarinimicrobiota bacterium]